MKCCVRLFPNVAYVSRKFNWSIFKLASKEERTVIYVYNVALSRAVLQHWKQMMHFLRDSIFF